jgi:hypothetical protein
MTTPRLLRPSVLAAALAHLALASAGAQPVCTADTPVDRVVFTVSGFADYATPLDVEIASPQEYTDVATPIQGQFRWWVGLNPRAAMANVSIMPKRAGYRGTRVGTRRTEVREGRCVGVLSFQFDRTWRVRVDMTPANQQISVAVADGVARQPTPLQTATSSPEAAASEGLQFWLADHYAGSVRAPFVIHQADVERQKSVRFARNEIVKEVCESHEGGSCGLRKLEKFVRSVQLKEIVFTFTRD